MVIIPNAQQILLNINTSYCCCCHHKKHKYKEEDVAVVTLSTGTTRKKINQSILCCNKNYWNTKQNRWVRKKKKGRKGGREGKKGWEEARHMSTYCMISLIWILEKKNESIVTEGRSIFSWYEGWERRGNWLQKSTRQLLGMVSWISMMGLVKSSYILTKTHRTHRVYTLDVRPRKETNGIVQKEYQKGFSKGKIQRTVAWSPSPFYDGLKRYLNFLTLPHISPSGDVFGRVGQGDYRNTQLCF